MSMIDSKKLIPEKAVKSFLKQIQDDQVNLHGFLMMLEDEVIYEGYWEPFCAESMHRMYSVGKSFTSIAIGLLVQEGKLKLTDTICTYFEDKLPKEGVHPWIKETTIQDMLCMTTAHHSTTYKRFPGDDWVKSFFHVEPTHKPGTIFSYDTSSTHVLSALVERLTGMELLDYLRVKFLDRIGFSKDAKILKDPMGVSQGGSGLICTLRDLALVANVCLHMGEYGGEQILPREYLMEATKKQVDTVLQPFLDEQFGYGYQIWKTRYNGFCFYGMGGQLAMCFPEHNFVFATTADTQGSPDGLKNIYDAFYQQVYPYLESDSFGDSEETLSDIINQLKVPVASSFFESNKEGKKVMAQSYSMQPNQMGLEELTVTIDGDIGYFDYKMKQKSHRLAFHLKEAFYQNFPDTQFECMCSGVWLTEDVLYIKTNIIEECFASMNMQLVFREDTVTICMKKAAEMFLQDYEGFATGTSTNGGLV